jgi:RNA polymerase sigma-70 factor (ECF subfamily)
MTQGLEDHRLFLRIAEGDPQAFRKLVDQHARPLVTYLTRLMNNQHEAEEIAQEVFVRVWQHANDYRPEFRATTWLHRIGHNLAIDQLRRRRGTEEFDAERDPAPSSARPSALLEQKQQANSLQAALDTLPLRQKTAMLLKYEQDFSNPDIATVLGLSVDAVESLLSRAKRQLKDQLAGELSHD